ncbi:hypothetical protein [Microbacterium sp. NPDC056234]|uniref:hypothetical protein n=1 Tax=Microbacterium sp. NPDC056234 TaxID=3345757 RepID=UPI0035E1512A
MLDDGVPYAVIARTVGNTSLASVGRYAISRKSEAAKIVDDEPGMTDVLSPTREYPSTVVTSTGHDAFADMAVQGTALLDRVIDSHSRAGRRNGAVFDTSHVRERAFDLAASVAPLRIANENHDYGLNLRGFPFGRIPSLPATEEMLANLAIQRSGTPLTAEALAEDIKEEAARLEVGPGLLIGDHDLFGALSRVLRDYGVTAGAETMSASFIAGLLCAHLGVTDWYQDLDEWGRRNSRLTFSCPCAA